MVKVDDVLVYVGKGKMKLFFFEEIQFTLLVKLVLFL